MKKQKTKILLIEDDRVDQMAFKRLVEDEALPYDYVVAGSVSDGRRALKHDDFDVVVIDYLLGNGTAFDLFEDVDPDVPVIIITGAGSTDIAVEAMKAGALDYIMKDHGGHYLKTLPMTVDNVIKAKRTERELKRYHDQLETMVEERTSQLKEANKQLKTEIRERKQTEEALRESEERFSLFMDHLPAVVFIKDEKSRALYVNRHMKEALGAKDWVGKTALDLFPKDLAEAMIADDRKALSMGYRMRVETVPDEDGKEQKYRTHKFAIRRAGKPPLLGGIAENITEQHRMEKELEKHRDHLEVLVKERTGALEEKTMALEHANVRLLDLDRLKSMFIASMSHELRTPLNSIIGFTGIILQGMTGEINSEQQDQLQRVYRSAKHLLALINDVIDISKIEAGKFDVHTEEFSLNGLIREAVSNFAREMVDKGLNLEVVLSQDVRLTTDRRRLLQCILNYLSNAVKFTEKGTVSITADQIDGIIEIKVSDTGIGIEEEDLDRLFESFVRLDSDMKIKTAGTGLGLYLTKKIATEILGGSVFVESRWGEGSTFGIVVPGGIEGLGN